MADPARARKLADRIQVVVAETLEKRIKDPRLGFVTVTDARVTGDLQQATLFYTVLGRRRRAAATAAALESAKGVLRSEVGRQTGVRLTPTLTFVADAVPENARAHRGPAAQAAERDAEVAALRRRRSYAGDADPYRRPDARARRRRRRGRDDDRGGADDAAAQPRRPPQRPRRPTACSSSTSRRAGPRHDVVARVPPARRAPAGSATRARWTRWRPGCSCSASAGPPGCSTYLVGARQGVRPRPCGSGRPRSPTTPRARCRPRADASGVADDALARRGRRADRPDCSRCPRRSARSRWTAGAPTPGCARGRTSPRRPRR